VLRHACEEVLHRPWRGLLREKRERRGRRKTRVKRRCVLVGEGELEGVLARAGEVERRRLELADRQGLMRPGLGAPAAGRASLSGGVRGRGALGGGEASLRGRLSVALVATQALGGRRTLTGAGRATAADAAAAVGVADDAFAAAAALLARLVVAPSGAAAVRRRAASVGDSVAGGALSEVLSGVVGGVAVALRVGLLRVELLSVGGGVGGGGVGVRDGGGGVGVDGGVVLSRVGVGGRVLRVLVRMAVAVASVALLLLAGVARRLQVPSGISLAHPGGGGGGGSARRGE